MVGSYIVKGGCDSPKIIATDCFMKDLSTTVVYLLKLV